MAIFDVFDEDVLSLLEEIDLARVRLQQIGEFSSNDLDRLKRAFLPDRISDTLNIESIQVNPRLTRAVLEGLTVSDTDKYAEQAIINVNEANLFIENAAASKDPLSLRHISEINRLIELGMGESRDPGRLRQIDLKITGSKLNPPHWAEVLSSVEKLVQEVESSRLHPVAQACFAHWGVANIHPFENGNGRTARLVQDMLLIRAEYLPVGIPIGKRADYYEALADADDGDGMSLVRIVASAELAALDKAYQVGSEEAASRNRVRQLLFQSQKKAENRDLQRYELWSRKADVLISELTRRFDQWNVDSDQIKFKYFVEDKPDFNKWKEIIKEGWAHQTHLLKFDIKQGRETVLSGLWYAKRHRLDFVSGSNSELRNSVGLFLTLAMPNAKFMVIDPLRDRYVEIREICPWENGYRIFTDPKVSGHLDDRDGMHFQFESPSWEMEEAASFGGYLDDFLEQLLRKCGFVE